MADRGPLLRYRSGRGCGPTGLPGYACRAYVGDQPVGDPSDLQGGCDYGGRGIGVVDPECGSIGLDLLERGAERLLRLAYLDESAAAEPASEPLLVIVDVLAELRVARYDERAVARIARLGDGRRATVADDDVCLGECTGEFGTVQECGAARQLAGARRAVLDRPVQRR